MENRLKTLLQQGKIAIGAQLRFGSPAIAELFGFAGFDYIIIDSEHAPQTPVGIQAQIQAIGCTNATPMVRMLKNDADMMRPYLDMGSQGFLVPFVNSGQEAKMGVAAVRYPPLGTRGYGPSRASKYGFDAAYFKEANDNMVYLPIIEDKLAIRNIDEILSVDGLDSFIIGPVDLSISLGVPMDFTNPKFKEAIKAVIKAAQSLKKPMGTAIYGGDMYTTDIYKRFVDDGFTLLLIGGDEWMLNSSCSKVMNCVSSVRG